MHAPRLARSRIAIDGRRVVLHRAGPERPGRAHPVLLVHGLGVSSSYMRPLARELAWTRHVVVPDLPGHGASDSPVGVPDEREHARMLAQIVEQELEQPAVVVGNSWGGQIAIELCRTRPDLVDSSVLLGPTLDRYHRSLLGQAVRLCALGAVEQPRLNVLQLASYLHTGPARTIREFRHAQRYPTRESARDVPQRVLVARGAGDPISTQAWVDDLAAVLPRGCTATIRAAGHVLNWWPASEVAAMIDSFAAVGEVSSQESPRGAAMLLR